MRNLKLTLKAWPVIAFATIGLCFLTDMAAKLCGIKLPPQPSLEAMLNSKGWTLCANLSLVLVAAPVLEELIFRGLIYRLPRWLLPKADVFWAVLSSVLFTSAHYIQMPFPDNAFIALMFFGMAQCWLYRQAGGWRGIWCPMLNHLLFNATNLVLLLIFPEASQA